MPSGALSIVTSSPTLLDEMETPDSRGSICSHPCSGDADRSRATLKSTIRKMPSNIASWRALIAASLAHDSTRSRNASSTRVIRSKRASLGGLSHELILMILNGLSLHSRDTVHERRSKRCSLSSCTTVSRTFRACATELLYAFVEVGSFPNSKKLLRTLHANPSYGRFVKELILPDQWSTRSSFPSGKKQRITAANMAVISSIIALCPRLHMLQISTTKDGPLLVMAPPPDEVESFILVKPFSNLLTLQVSHYPFYDFSVRSPLPYHIEFSQLENLSLHRFVVWSDDALPMVWPPMPRLSTLCLEECFLHGDELAALLVQVKDTIRTVRLVNSIFSISVISDGLSAVAEVLEELFISEHWGFDSVSEAFDRFTALRVLRLEPANWGPHVYERLPPRLERLAIWATEDSFSGWRVVEDIIGFLQMDIPNLLPHFRSFHLKAEANQFGAWVDHIQSLCDGHGIDFAVELIEAQPRICTFRPRYVFWSRLEDAWDKMKHIGRRFLPPGN